MARVRHADPYPRNMMVQEDTDRVLWIDFDSAQTHSEVEALTPRQEELIDVETGLMDEFAGDIVHNNTIC